MLDKTKLEVIGVPAKVVYDYWTLAREAKRVVLADKTPYVVTTDETFFKEVKSSLKDFGLDIKKVMLGETWVDCVISKKRTRRSNGRKDTV